MINDPIVEEMRKNGQLFVVRYSNNLAAICTALREIEQASDHKLINRVPYPLPTKQGYVQPARKGTMRKN